jgi:hypothetical protein
VPLEVSSGSTGFRPRPVSFLRGSRRWPVAAFRSPGPRAGVDVAGRSGENGAVLPLIPPRLPRVTDRRGSRDDSLGKLLERIQKGEKERRTFRDRRGTPRVAIAIDVRAGAGENRVALTTHDLSTFGLSLKGGVTPPKGTRLVLELLLPDEPAQPLTLKGVVLGALDEKGGARVKFVNPPIEALRRIHRFLK